MTCDAPNAAATTTAVARSRPDQGDSLMNVTIRHDTLVEATSDYTGVTEAQRLRDGVRLQFDDGSIDTVSGHIEAVSR
jgi:hypothetical protein